MRKFPGVNPQDLNKPESVGAQIQVGTSTQVVWTIDALLIPRKALLDFTAVGHFARTVPWMVVSFSSSQQLASMSFSPDSQAATEQELKAER